MCHVLSHLTKLNIIISFYNILMHFEIVFSTVAAVSAYVVVLHCCTAPETMWKMNFHIFLLLGKKKENASFLFLLCVCAAARQ